MSLVDELKKIVEAVGQENVYRSIYDNQGNLILEGKEPIKDNLIAEFSRVDFRGKSVIDLGCNFAFFSFLTKKLGASRVTGIDICQKIIEGCKLLSVIFEMSGVEFKVDNIEAPNIDYNSFDIVMLIDYFGRGNIRKRKIEKILSDLSHMTRKEILLVIRPVLKVREQLRIETEELAKLYPGEYMKNNCFYLLDYVKDSLGKDWRMNPISPLPEQYSKEKRLFQFVRETSCNE